MSYFAAAFRAMARPVPDSDDLRRILSLSRRSAVAVPPAWVDRHRLKPGGMTPNETQAAAMYEASMNGGLLGFIGLGIGKGPLGPWLCAALTKGHAGGPAALLVPSPLVAQTQAIVEALSPYWLLPWIEIIGYGKLSNKKYANLLQDLAPTVIVADECHRLRAPGAAATKRVRAAVKAGAKFAGMSGTLLSRSIRDWAHLAAWALKKGSPAPLEYPAREAFAWALDDLRSPFENCAPGALGRALGATTTEELRARYRELVEATPGVIVSSKMSCDASITLRAIRPRVPKEVTEALKDARTTWTTPDGDEFDDALRRTEFAMQMSQGFYLRWDPPAPPEWLDARRAWHQEVRCRPPRYDSPGVYEDAVKAGAVRSLTYAPWKMVEPSFRPKSVVTWLSDFLIGAVEKWLDGPPGVVWVWHPLLGRALAERTGLHYYGAGEDAAREILKVDGTSSIICSADSHGTGRNLQAYARMLVTRCPMKADELEQLVGRIHRQGQKADELEIDVFCHTSELDAALQSALQNARVVEASPGGLPQRLCSANVIT